MPHEERQEIEEPWLEDVWDETQLDPRVWGVTLLLDVTVDMLHLQVKHAGPYLAHVNALERLPSQSGRVLGYPDLRSVWPALWSVDADPAPGPHLAADCCSWVSAASTSTGDDALWPLASRPPQRRMLV